MQLIQSSAVHAPQLSARSEMARPMGTSRGMNTTPAEAFSALDEVGMLGCHGVNVLGYQ